MKKLVTLTEIEANLVALAAQTRDAGIARLNEAFNAAVGPVLRAHDAEQVEINVDPKTKKVTMSWEVPETKKRA